MCCIIHVYISGMYSYFDYSSPNTRQYLLSSPVENDRLWESHGEDRSRDDEVENQSSSHLLADGVGKEVDELKRIASKSEEGGKPEKVVDDPQSPPKVSRPWGVGLFSG